MKGGEWGFPWRYDEAWILDALCKGPGMDPDWWFPKKGGGQEAIAVCTRCPVRLDCLEAAVTAAEDHGIWGGAGELTRRRLRSTLESRGKRGLRIEIDDHFSRLDEAAERGRMPEGQAVTYGAGASHGRASTYARGCRCPKCREARIESQRRNAEAKRHLFGGDAA